MHRHGYKGRKFGRERAQRTALIHSLAESLVRDGSITTTKPKAKELVPYFEKLITKAKKGDLASRRRILQDLTVESSHRLVDEIIPQLQARSSGHLRVKTTGFRRGDNAVMARVSFVDEIKTTSDKSPVSKAKSAAKKDTTKEVEPAKPEIKPIQDALVSQPKAASEKQVPKRSGVRGNR